MLAFKSNNPTQHSFLGFRVKPTIQPSVYGQMCPSPTLPDQPGAPSSAGRAPVRADPRPKLRGSLRIPDRCWCSGGHHDQYPLLKLESLSRQLHCGVHVDEIVGFLVAGTCGGGAGEDWRFENSWLRRDQSLRGGVAQQSDSSSLNLHMVFAGGVHLHWTRIVRPGIMCA